MKINTSFIIQTKTKNSRMKKFITFCKEEKTFLRNCLYMLLCVIGGTDVVIHPEDQSKYFIIGVGIMFLVIGISYGLEAIIRIAELRLKYLKHVEKFRIAFNEVTKFNLSLKQFIKHARKFTKTRKINYYNIDYTKFQEYVENIYDK